MAKTKVPKLKLTWWQELIYYVFVAIVPLVLACIEIFSSHSSIFKITFTSIGAVLLVIIVIKKFVFNERIKNLQSKCTMLEHDYSIEVGNKDNIRAQWGQYNAIVYAYNAVVTVLTCVLLWLFFDALSSQLIKFNTAMILILSSVIIACAWKLILYIRFMRLDDAEEGTDESGSEQVQH